MSIKGQIQVETVHARMTTYQFAPLWLTKATSHVQGRRHPGQAAPSFEGHHNTQPCSIAPYPTIAALPSMVCASSLVHQTHIQMLQGLLHLPNGKFRVQPIPKPR